MTYRGSRKHVLDWVEQSRFLPELLTLARPVDCRVRSDSLWAPVSYDLPEEARLEAFGPRAMPGHPAWPRMRSWWLKYEAGANTPNWDIALSCDVEGQAGLILVEAKANCPELSAAGKPRSKEPSVRSQQNHDQIVAAIEEARGQLAVDYSGIAISAASHYQLSNRLAFAWRLATLGIPVVLIYLGFCGDSGITNVGEPFRDDAHWQQVFKDHVSAVWPGAIYEAPIRTDAAPFWLLARSRVVLKPSVQSSNER